MTRFRDWQSRFGALLAERRASPFAWGTNDCCVFACDCARAITGTDPAEGLRDHRTEEEAAVVLEQHGGVMQLADARLGERIRPVLAAVGDIGLVTMLQGPGLAVCNGQHWIAPGPNGLMTLPKDAARMAWRV